MEEEKGIVIPCKHLSEERRRTKRVIGVKILYREVETRIDCENESVAPITHHHLTLSRKSFKQGSCNPVGCEECKSDIMDYFTTVIAHPNPDGVFADLCTQLNAYLLQGIPDPRVLTDLTRRSIDIGSLGTYMRDIIREENPVIEVVSYQICNYMERHNLGQRQGSNDNSEWHVTWLGARLPQLTHPRLGDFNLDKVDGQSLDAIEDFTCPICLKDHVKRSVDAQVNLADNLVALPCQHIFHQSCISLWLDRANCCPQCRFQLPSPCVAWSTRPNSGFGNFSAYKIEAL